MDASIVDPGQLLTGAQFAGLVLAPLMSLLVGLVTKASWDARVRPALLLALAAINGAVVEALSSQTFSLKAFALRAGLAFITAVAAHYGFLKPTGAAAAVSAMGVKDKPPLAIAAEADITK
jgi:hypothetical protein